MQPIARQLAAFAVDLRPDAVPDRVRERAVLHVVDAVGCGLAAVGVGAGAHATRVALEQGGTAAASVLGDRRRLPAAPAAFANGTRCHSLDFDDTHERAICHSSAVVLPAALAVGEACAADGGAVVDAYVAGSEVTLRLGVALADGLYARGLHPTSVCGVFGATAAAARLLGLDVPAATHALGIAGSFASGLLEYLSDGSATKPLHAGWAAQAGIHAAQLAAAGATGPASVIEGRFGLAVSHARARADLGTIAEGVGRRWEMAELAIKPYPACHFAHASTWAAGELVDEHGIEVGDIAEIVVRAPAEGVRLVLEPSEAKRAPLTPYDAKFSLPYTVAHRVVHGHLDLASFSEDRIRDADVLALADRVHGERLERPPSRFAGSALIRTTAGTTVERLVEHTPGSPRNPLEPRWVLDKFLANAQLALPPARAREAMETLRTLPTLGSLEPVGAVLTDAAEGSRA